METTWRFSEEKNQGVFTTTQITVEGSPIVYVSHDRDGDWHFFPSEAASEEDGVLVGLGRIVEMDETIGELWDLPMGWCAQRTKVGAAWERTEEKETA